MSTVPNGSGSYTMMPLPLKLAARSARSGREPAVTVSGVYEHYPVLSIDIDPDDARRLAAQLMIAAEESEPPITVPEGPPEHRRTYECGCGYNIVDDSDDVDGYYADVYEHEEHCDGSPALAPQAQS